MLITAVAWLTAGLLPAFAMADFLVDGDEEPDGPRGRYLLALHVILYGLVTLALGAISLCALIVLFIVYRHEES